MSFQVGTSSGVPLAVPPGGGTIANYGPGILYYRDEFPVSSTVNDGNIASGSSLPFFNSLFVIASAVTAVDVKPIPATATPVTTPTTNVQTGDYTLVGGDANISVEINSGSNRTVTVPAEATVNFPVGTIIEVDRIGTGTVTLAAAGGVTIRSAGSLLSLRAQYSGVTLRKRATDDWLLTGDLA